MKEDDECLLTAIPDLHGPSSPQILVSYVRTKYVAVQKHVLVKVPLRVHYGNIAQGCGREDNIAWGKPECYICLKTT